MDKYYSITIPVKPYIQKYIQSLYGTPVKFTTENFFGMTVLGFLDRKFYFRQNKELVHRSFDKFTCQMQMYFPRWWMLQAHFGLDLPPQNIIFLNKLFEERFEEDLAKHCRLQEICGVQIKHSMEEFCNLHNIVVDEDISEDALKKKEYRTRQQFSKDFIANVSTAKNHFVQTNLFN